MRTDEAFEEAFGLKIGDRIELLSMPDDPDPIEVGAQGTVDWLNDGSISQIGVIWDNGRTLMLIPGKDRWAKL